MVGTHFLLFEYKQNYVCSRGKSIFQSVIIDMPKKSKEDMTSESKENVATEDLSMSDIPDPNASVTGL